MQIVYCLLCEREGRFAASATIGPCLVEATCFRFLSHTTDDDDGTYRSPEEVALARINDPAPKFGAWPIERALIDAQEAQAVQAEIKALINATTDAVERESVPEARDLYGNVYGGPEDAWL